MKYTKYILFGCLSLGLISCGQSSKIKNPIEAQSFAQAYGDGEHWVEKFSLNIAPVPFEGALPKLGPAGPVVNQLVKLLLDVGFVEGTRKYSLNQPVPELPSEYIEAIKLSRVFIVLEDEKIDFINKLAVMVTPRRIRNEQGIMYTSPTSEVVLTKEDKRRYMELFNPKSLAGQVANKRQDEEVVMFKYDRGNPRESTNTKNLEYVELITTSNPQGLLDHILYNLEFKRQGKIVHYEQMADAILIETIPDPAVKTNLDEELTQITRDPSFGIKKRMTCNPSVCLDVRLPGQDILHLILKENAIQLDAFIDVDRAPKTFKLKGYVQFTAVIRDPILVDGVGVTKPKP